MKKSDSGRIGIPEKIRYSCGELGNQMVQNMLSSYILLFFTNIVGIPAKIGGTIIAIATVFDAINDPIIGSLADRTRTRWGTYRPWIVAAAVPAALCMVLLFINPGLSMEATIVYFCIMYCLWSVCNTTATMSYGALSSVMTQDDKDRISLGAFREWTGNVGAFAFSGGAIYLIYLFGDGTLSNARGFLGCAIFVGVIAAAGLLIVGFGTKERIPVVVHKSNILKSLLSIFKNKATIVLMFIAIGISMMTCFRGMFATYYAMYYLENEGMIPVILMVMTAMPIVALPFVPKLVAKLGRRKLFFISGALGVLCGVTSLVAQKNVPLIILASVLCGLALAGTSANLYSSVPDAAEYGEWKTGVFCPAVIYACLSLMFKVGSALTSGITGNVLSLAGFDTDPAGAAQAIYLWNGLIPIICGAVLLIFGLLYFITPELMKKVHTENDAAHAQILIEDGKDML